MRTVYVPPGQLSAELYRRALEGSSDAVVSVDRSGFVISADAGFLRLTDGDSSTGAIDRLFPPGCRPLDFYDARQGQISRDCILSAARGSVKARIVYAWNADSVLTSIRIDHTPVSSESPRWLSAVLDATDSIVIVLDREGRFKRFNRAAQLITGYTIEDLAHRSFWEVVLFEEDIPAIRAEFDRLFAGETVASRFEHRWKMKDGSERMLSWSNTVTRGADGRVEYIVGTALDLTFTRMNELALASLSGEFMEAQSIARRNVSRYLHDTVSQDLVVLALTLSKMDRESNDNGGTPEVAPTLEIVDRCCRDLRVISYALAPPAFDDTETAAVFDWYINHLREDAGVDVEFHAAPMGQIPVSTRKLLVAAMQEWAVRAIRSRTAGKAGIHLGVLDSTVRLDFFSDQPGDEAIAAVAGSRVIRERVRALGGTFEIHGRRPGVSVVIPMPQGERPA